MHLRTRVCVWFAAGYLAAASLVGAYTNELDALNAIFTQLETLNGYQFDASWGTWQTISESAAAIYVTRYDAPMMVSNTIKNWSGQLSNQLAVATNYLGHATNQLERLLMSCARQETQMAGYSLGFTNFVSGSQGFWSTNHEDLAAILGALKNGLAVTGNVSATATIEGSIEVTQGTVPWLVHDGDVHDSINTVHVEVAQYKEEIDGVPYFRVASRQLGVVAQTSAFVLVDAELPPAVIGEYVMSSTELGATNSFTDGNAWTALPGRDGFLAARDNSIVPTNDWTVPIPMLSGSDISFNVMTQDMPGLANAGYTNFMGLCDVVEGSGSWLNSLKAGARSNNFYITKSLFVPWDWSTSFPSATDSIEVDFRTGFDFLGSLIPEYEAGTYGRIYLNLQGFMEGVPGGWSAFIGAVSAARTIMLLGVLFASFVWAWRILRSGVS